MVPEPDRTSNEVAVNSFQNVLFRSLPTTAAANSRAASAPFAADTANTPSAPVSSRRRAPMSGDIVTTYGLFATSSRNALSTSSPSGVVNRRSKGSVRSFSSSPIVSRAVCIFASRYESCCTISAYTPSDTLLTNSRPLTVP